MESFAPKHIFGLLERIEIELLWDIEKVVDGGRCYCSRSVTSVWSRAEVISIANEESRAKAKLRYEERDGFKEQIGDVWVFPFHVKVVGDEATQLPWRFYECSGGSLPRKRRYQEHEGSLGDEDREWKISEDEVGSKNRLAELEERLATIAHKHETLERFVVSSSRQQFELMGEGSCDDRNCEMLINLLRMKTAIFMRRGIPPMRSKKDSGDEGTFFEDCFSSSMKTEVDCSFREFQLFARVTRSRMDDPHFRPTFAETKNPSSRYTHMEICFPPLLSIYQAIRISKHSYLLFMARRDKRVKVEKDRYSSESALRVPGTCLFNPDDDKSPTAFLVCQGIDRSRVGSTAQAFFRHFRDFDFSSMCYEKPLCAQELTIGDLIRRFTKRISLSKRERRIQKIVPWISMNLRKG